MSRSCSRLPWARDRKPGDLRRSYRPTVEFLESHLLLSVIYVTTSADNGNNFTPTLGSLRAAILAANKQPGTTIDFDIGSGAQTIKPPKNLPMVTAPLTIDGTSQPGYSDTPLITLDGTMDSNGSGLILGTNSGGSTVKGLAILYFMNDLRITSAQNTIGGLNFGTGNILSGNNYTNTGGNGVFMDGPGAWGNVVEGNRIGTNAAGTAAMPNYVGVMIENGAANNTIGGTAPGAGNLISGNTVGVQIFRSSENVVEGNFIGTNAAGTAAVPTSGTPADDDGIKIKFGTKNTIGGTARGAGNLISGFYNDCGIEFLQGASANVVEGNRIGTNAAGTAAVPNLFGVGIFPGAADNTIGGPTAGSGNLISGNSAIGVYLAGLGTTGNLAGLVTTGNVVEGNLIGTAADGIAALPNGSRGVLIANGATNNTIGGTISGSGNLISGNSDNVVIRGQGTSGNVVEGNRIGSAALSNRTGVSIFNGATNNTIGGASSGAGNLISGHRIGGVVISGSGTSGNLVEGNRIGTTTDGTAALPNGSGVTISSGATNNTIGGTISGAGNLISGNTGGGVVISNLGTSANVVEGNLIGTTADGTAALPNRNGVSISSGAKNNTIGGIAQGAGNTLSGNTMAGVVIFNLGTSGNLVQGNRIGTKTDGTAALPNGNGVSISSGATNNTIGGTTLGTGNTISGNTIGGVVIAGKGTSGNLVEGNRIGTTANGTAALPNGNGVSISSGATNNTIGGTISGSANTIAFNTQNGVTVGSSKTDVCTGNAILGDAIFANTKLGIDLANNGVTLNNSSGHTGPNLFQNFPVLTTVTSNGTTTTISGTLDSSSSKTFHIELFANPTADSSGYGEGQTFLGFIHVTTNASGHGDFTFSVNLAFGGQWITVTATDPAGNTSEFSKAVVVASV